MRSSYQVIATCYAFCRNVYALSRASGLLVEQHLRKIKTPPLKVSLCVGYSCELGSFARQVVAIVILAHVTRVSTCCSLLSALTLP